MTENKVATTQGKQIAKQQNIADEVLVKVNTFQENKQLDLPDNYSPANALKSAYLVLSETVDKNGKSVLETCTRNSIASALLNMVIQGLSPMKSQCSFVAYGGKLTLQREYAGTMALAKRFGGVLDVQPQPIYKDDDFEYIINPSTGKKKIIKHSSKLQNIDINNIVGAYAVVIFEDGREPDVEIMTMKQIRTSWEQGYAKGNSPAHNKFTDEMACKTVINRACKPYINSSDDGQIVSIVDGGQENRTNKQEQRSQDDFVMEYEEVSMDEKEQPEPTKKVEEKKIEKVEKQVKEQPKKAEERPKENKEETKTNGQLEAEF